jgi:putative ABC transport system permease protein
MNVVSLGIRNAFRNSVRTISIVSILGLSIGLSLVMLIANQAVGDKIESVRKSIGNSISISPAGFSSASSVNNGLTVAQVDKLKSIEHITSVTKTLHGTVMPKSDSGEASPVMMGPDGSKFSETNLKPVLEFNKDSAPGGGGGMVISSGIGGGIPTDFQPPIGVLGTSDPTATQPQDESKFTLAEGKFIDGAKDSDEVMVSDKMATKNNLKVGSTFSAYDKTLTVVGIFKTETQFSENTIVTSLPTLQRLSDNAGAIDGAVASVDSVANIDGATKAVKDSLGSSADVTDSKQMVENAIEPLQDIQKISIASLIGSVIAGGVIILLAMVMVVRERRREIGILKAIGSSNIRIVTQFMVESLTLTLLGLAIAVVIGVVAGGPVTRALAGNSGPGGGAVPKGGGVIVGIVGGGINDAKDIQAKLGYESLLGGLATSIVIALFGSAVSSIIIAKVKPAEVLRSE